MIDEQPLPAGRFSEWLDGMQRAIEDEQDSDVPCNGCTACCTSSQFVHIAPDESDTLAHVPEAWRFPAAGYPEGHVLLGHDENGHCPMLIDNKCSIYEHRPRTCRTYDCRIYVATGVDVDNDKPAIARRVARWRFDFLDGLDREKYEAVRSISMQLSGQVSGTQRAVLAVQMQGLKGVDR